MDTEDIITIGALVVAAIIGIVAYFMSTRKKPKPNPKPGPNPPGPNPPDPKPPGPNPPDPTPPKPTPPNPNPPKPTPPAPVLPPCSTVQLIAQYRENCDIVNAPLLSLAVAVDGNRIAFTEGNPAAVWQYTSSSYVNHFYLAMDINFDKGTRYDKICISLGEATAGAMTMINLNFQQDNKKKNLLYSLDNVTNTLLSGNVKESPTTTITLQSVAAPDGYKLRLDLGTTTLYTAPFASTPNITRYMKIWSNLREKVFYVGNLTYKEIVTCPPRSAWWW